MTNSTLTIKRRFNLLTVSVLMTALVGFAYFNTLQAPFAFDDTVGIVNNANIHVDTVTCKTLAKACFSGPYAQRPLANLSFAFNYYLHRLNVTGYHLVNIFLHITNGLLVFLLFQITLRLNEARRGQTFANETPLTNNLLAGLAAILWIVHPLHTQSVTYILQRMNVMGATFSLTSLWCYIQGRLIQKDNPHKRFSAWLFFTVTVLAAVCAWSSKQNTAALPFFILLYEWFFLSRPTRRRHYLAAIAVAAAIFGLLALIYLGPAPLKEIDNLYATKQFTMTERLLTQPGIILFYISLIFFPYPGRLTLDHDFPLSLSLIDPLMTLPALAALSLLAAAAVLTFNRHRLTAWAIIWFLGNLVIESSFLGAELMFEHRLYLPSIFLVLTAARWLQRRLRRPAFFAAVMILAIGIGLTWTWQRNKVWETPVSLWEDSTEKSWENARAHHNLAFSYNNQGDFKNAVVHYRRALDILIHKPNPDLALIATTWNNLGEAFNNANNPGQALNCFQRTLNILLQYRDQASPEIIKTYNNIGFVYVNCRDYTTAIRYFEKALHFSISALGAEHINTAMTYNNLANMYQQLGEYDKAIDMFEQALPIFLRLPDPKLQNVPTAYNNLGVAHSLAGQYDEGIAYFQQALNFYRRHLGADNPFLGISYINLGRAYRDKRDINNAASCFQKAYDIFRKKLGPDHPYTQSAEKELKYTRRIGQPY